LGTNSSDLDRTFALNGDGLKLLGVKLQVFALPDFIALDDVGGVDLVTALRVDLPVLDAVAGILVELMETDLFPLTGRWIKRDRAGHERELQIAFPIGARGHDFYSGTERRIVPNVASATL
jgi:hypothetical protein